MNPASKRIPFAVPPLALAGLVCAFWARPPSSPAPSSRNPESPSTLSAPKSPSASLRPDSTPSVRTETGTELARRCLALAERDPLAAMDLALRENLCALDPGLLPSLILRWAGQDFDGALAWTRAQAEPDWRDDLLSRLAYLRAQTDPLAAARIVVADITEGPLRDEAILSVLHQWTLRDADSARLWADSLPAGPLRNRAMTEVAAITSTGS